MLVFLSGVLVMAQTGYSILTEAVFLAAIGMLEFFLTLILFLLHLFSIPENHQNIPWAIIELVYDVIATLLLFVAALVLAIKLGDFPVLPGLLITADVSYTINDKPIQILITLFLLTFQLFGFFSLVPFGYDLYLKLKETGILK